MRDPRTKKFTEEFTRSEFEYLYGCQWEGYEKIDGTNIRIIWDMWTDAQGARIPMAEIEGRTDNAQLPTGLMAKLQQLFPEEKLLKTFNRPENPVVLYGEGVGPKIQPPGERNSKDFDFVLFDIRIGKWWLKQQAVTDIGKSLGLKRAHHAYTGTLTNAEAMVEEGFLSCNAEDRTLQAEGLILRPKMDLIARNGDRIITKLKTKDYY